MGAPLLSMTEENLNFGEYETNIVQLSDTELDGVPYDEIAENYGEGEADAFVYAGDASKKQGNDVISPEEYLEQFEETYEDLSKIQEETDTEVLVEPGNHAPIAGAHTPWNDEEDIDTKYVEEVETLLEDEYEEFADYDGNSFEFLAEEYNLTNIEYNSVEVGDLTIIGGTHHDGEMEKIIEKEWLEETPGLEELGYDTEELAEEIEVDNSYDGILSDVPIVGNILDYFLGETRNPEPEEITLEDVPEDYGMTEIHQNLEEALELKNYFEESIENADTDIYLTHHGAPTSTAGEYGSAVVDNIVDNYSDEIAIVGGGHTGSAGIDEYQETPVFNTNYGAVAEIGYQKGEVVYSDIYNKSEQGQASIDDLSDEELIRQTVPLMAQTGGPEKFYENMGQLPDAAKNRLDELRPQIEEEWENLQNTVPESIEPQRA